MATAWISNWSPINSFPNYHGPYEVGTVDVEVPAADLPPPSAVPEDAPPTIAFRMFYPCVKPSSSAVNRPVRWIPQPQRLTTAALMKFLGVRERAAGMASYLLQHLYWINIQAHRNAQLLEPPTSNGRWPVTIFSHGLAGSRNAYSYICGDLASNGMIVIALDHRDGSSPVQYVRATAETEAHIVHTIKISHEPSNEVYEARDKQLRIRLWEISVALEALMKIDAGEEVENLDQNTSRRRQERVEVLWQFDGKLDIHRAGKVSWVGHSFGAATIIQLLKSIYYSSERPEGAGTPLVTPNADAAILHQIMPESPVLLLDLWGLPLQSPEQTFLWEKPLPSYSARGPQGENILSILSEGFRNWQDNLNINKHVAGPSGSSTPSEAPRLTREKGRLLPSWARLQEQSPSRDSGYASQDTHSPTRSLTMHARGGSDIPQLSQSSSQNPSPHGRSRTSKSPHMFFVQRSQHFNQSDFGILFPFLARRFTKAEEPERILELNTRAMVQVMREAGIEVAGEDDREVLDVDNNIRRWFSIPLEDNKNLATENKALDAVNRKLSINTTNSDAAPNDVIMGDQKMETQLEC